MLLYFLAFVVLINMKLQIPKNMPQFSDSPSLFMSVNVNEAHFYLAHQGKMEELESFETSPETIEKKQFQARIDYTIHSLLDEYQFRSIYLFAPEHVTKRIVKGLEPSEEEKIKALKALEQLD